MVLVVGCLVGPFKPSKAVALQGLILPPALLIMALKDFHTQPEPIANVHFNLYADDPTVWRCRGSPGHQEHELQEAIDVLSAYTKHNLRPNTS